MVKLHDDIIAAQKTVGEPHMEKMVETEKLGHCPKFIVKNGVFESDFTRGSGLVGEVNNTEHTSGLSRVFGVQRASAINTLLVRQINATDTSSSLKEDELNGAPALIDEIGPRDALEGLMVSQMVANYHAAMDLLGKARRTDYVDRIGLYTANANKLMNTYSRQMVSLQRYREEASQTVIVKHVNVKSGGRAIVGDINTGVIIIKVRNNPGAPRGNQNALKHGVYAQTQNTSLSKLIGGYSD